MTGGDNTANSDRERKSIKFLILAVVISVIVLFFVNLPEIIGSYFVSLRESEQHIFDIESPGPFLSDNAALSFAKKTLVAEGYKLTDWRPVKDSPTWSPDGKKDGYLFRGENPQCGFIQFVNDANDVTRTRVVDIEISETRMTTCVRIPK